MMLKDLGLAQAAARDKQVNTTLGAAAEAIYKQYCESGGAPRDFSGIYQQVARKTS
jgi:3-hydroxyisobutyrate dehydrogenase